MASSIELKRRLREFLADPRADKEFRPWFASLLIDKQEERDENLETLVHAIHRAFSDAAEGLYSPQELRSLLLSLSQEPISVNQMIVIQASVLPYSVNQLVVEERAFPASFASSGTSREGVFASARPLPA